MTSKRAAAILGALAFGLSTVITLEDRVGNGPAEARVAPRRAHLADRPAGSPAPVDDTDRWSAAILVRPLFSASRRPPASAAANASAPAAAVRLAGILVSAHDKVAIFAQSGEPKPIVAHVGSKGGDDVVQAIEPDRVTMRGPDGEKVLRPAYQPKEAAALSGPSEQQRPLALRARRGGSETGEQAADLGR